MKLTNKQIKEFEYHQKTDGTRAALTYLLDKIYEYLDTEVAYVLNSVYSQVEDRISKRLIIDD